MTNVACESNLSSVLRSGTCGRIHAQDTGWHSCVQSSIMPGLPTHLAHGLNADPVLASHTLSLNCTLFGNSQGQLHYVIMVNGFYLKLEVKWHCVGSGNIYT